MTILAIILGCIVVIQLGFIVSLYRTMVYYRSKCPEYIVPANIYTECDDYFDDI